jgi:hypothetical protein
VGKNITIYLPEDVAEKMETFSEVNWSEICRRAVLDYIQTRSQIDLAPIIERLKKERNTDYKQGQITIYKEIIPKLSWKTLEQLRPRIDKKLMTQQPKTFMEEPLSPLAAERTATNYIRNWIQQYAKQNKIQISETITDTFCEGAIDALIEVYNRTKTKQG